MGDGPPERSAFTVRSSAPSWLRRDDSAAGILTFSLLVGASAAWMLSAGARAAPSSLAERAALTGFLSLACFAMALALHWLARARSLRAPVAVAGSATTVYALTDTYFRGIFRHHLTESDLTTGLDAIRTGAIPVSTVDVAALAAFSIVLAMVAYLLLALLANLPGPRVVGKRSGAAAVFAGLYLLLYFRDLWSSGAAPGDWLAGALSVHRPEQADQRVRDGKDEEFRLDGSLQEGTFGQLRKIADENALGIVASSTPDILFIHAESLRADCFDDDLFKETFARSSDCRLAPRHYSTGNTTPNGIFGALTGLSPIYFELARKHRLLPLPLRALRELGYATHVWYPNEALDFDDLLHTVVGAEIEVHRVSGEPVHTADALTVEGFARTSQSTGPRFDYVLLDSSHYDYSYPERYERFTPSGTLGLRFNPRTGEGIDKVVDVEAAKRQREKVLNRYKNALLYLDSLVASLIDVARSRGRPVAIVLFGDHGESFWDDGGSFGHSTELSEAQTRVPALFCLPGVRTLEHEVSSHTDIFPTVFDWMGVRAKFRFMTGKSLLRAAPGLEFAIARGGVTQRGASHRYLVADEHHRIGILQADPPLIQWVQDARGLELGAPPKDAVTRAFAELLIGTLLRSPELRPPR